MPKTGPGPDPAQIGSRSGQIWSDLVPIWVRSGSREGQVPDGDPLGSKSGRKVVPNRSQKVITKRLLDRGIVGVCDSENLQKSGPKVVPRRSPWVGARQVQIWVPREISWGVHPIYTKFLDLLRVITRALRARPGPPDLGSANCPLIDGLPDHLRAQEP